ncbi:ELL [Bugula neritina]|uniref:ELL n=1 Tax=Bugula neritina TaxID=10212 RepID=A0A7J7IZ67_BUGNE|nr:ELL [Bugula neritina]
MMALKEGCQYGLLSNDSTIRANLSCAHVKLTDAAAKVIEDYHLKNKTNQYKPTIEIGDDQGIIRIHDGQKYKEFYFTVRPQPIDPNGSYDCIKQARNGKLEMLDTMSQRITVSATDEVYQTTKDKLTVKNEESKKYCAKEIDQTKGGVKSKKITKTIRSNHNGMALTSSARSTSISQSNLKQTKNDSTSDLPTRSPNSNSHFPGGFNTSPPSSAVTAQSNTYNSSATMANSQTNAAKKLDKLKRKQQTKRNTQAKEAAVAHNKTVAPSKSEREKMKAALLTVPIRERIVHALAAKPNVFDTPQLLAKFKSEGLNTTEHLKEIHDTLTLVGLPNGKRCWALRPEYFGEVDVNWSFYSETDKQLVKRNLNRPISSSVASSIAGTATSSSGVRPVVAVHPTSDTSKRKTSDDRDPDLPLLKRDRLDPDSVNEDFMEKYPDISSYDQRNSFKNDFNDDYPEYITLFEHFKKKYNDKFQRLADRLRASAPGSGEYKKIEEKIRKKHAEITFSHEYRSKKLRLDYLQQKLHHIKKKVQEYDRTVWGNEGIH